MFGVLPATQCRGSLLLVSGNLSETGTNYCCIYTAVGKSFSSQQGPNFEHGLLTARSTALGGEMRERMLDG
jgi:hypothetical protein